MKRRFLVVQLTVACVLLHACVCARAQSGDEAPVIVYNGALLRTDLPLASRNGQLYLPLTPAVCYSLGAEMDAYLEQDRIRAVVQWFGRQIEFTEGQAQMLVDGLAHTLAAAAYSDTAGVLMVPALPFFTAVEAEAQYDPAALSLRVTRRIEAPDIVSQLPPELAPKPADAAQQGMTDAQLEEFMGQSRGMIFTIENSFGAEVDSISGDRTQSYLTPRQVLLDRLTLRMEGSVAGGFHLDGFMRAASTTDRDQKRGEIQKMYFLLERPGLSVTLYDVLPKFSRYTMRNYRLQGADVKHVRGAFTYQAAAGISPKKFKDSEYSRLAGAARAQWGPDTRHVALNFAAVRDTGAARGDEKLDNRVGSVSARATHNGWDMFGELAAADTDLLLAGRNASSTALQLQARRKTRHSTLDLNFENTGADFYSESTSFTQGKHEWSALWNAKPHARMTLGLGHRNRLLKGNRTYIYPVLVGLSPSASRTRLKVDLRRNYERTTGASRSLVDNRLLEVRDKLGSVSVQATLGRRKTKDNSGESAIRATFDYRAQFLVAPKILCVTQFSKEKRQNSTTPLTRYYRTGFTIEVGEWTDMSIAIERYYNASGSNRLGAVVGFRHLDVKTDTEYLFDYSFMNYPAHNDHSIKMRYNVYR